MIFLFFIIIPYRPGVPDPPLLLLQVVLLRAAGRFASARCVCVSHKFGVRTNGRPPTGLGAIYALFTTSIYIPTRLIVVSGASETSSDGDGGRAGQWHPP